MAGADAARTLTLGDVLREQARSHPHREAVVCREHRWTYTQLDERVNSLAHVLTDLGISPGERVLWLGKNCHRLLETILASAKLGATCCPANWRNRHEELFHVIQDLAPQVIVFDLQSKEALRAIEFARRRDRAWAERSQVIFGYEGFGSFDARVSDAPAHDPQVVVEPTSPLLALYTAAFEGEPSAALISHTAVIWQSLTWSATHDFTADTRYLASEPMFHVAGLMNLLGVLHRGGTNVMMERVSVPEIVELVETERITTAYFVTKTIRDILDYLPRLDPDLDVDLTSLRSPPRDPQWDRLVTLGTSPWDRAPGGYGQTETMGMLTYRCLGSRPPPGTQARAVDGAGREVAVGEVGELVARGPTVMNGYHDRPDVNARRQRDAWHHTNDLARREPDGSITWLGSMDRLVKTGSENVYPAEVEACIRTHPAVASCRVSGVPDPSWGELVAAQVVPREGIELEPDEIERHCRRRLASYKCPRRIEIVAHLTQANDPAPAPRRGDREGRRRRGRRSA